jgi:hypothetical protein
MEHRLITSVCAGFVLASVLGSVVLAGPAIQEPAVTYGFEGEFCSSSTSTLLEFENKGNKTRLLLENTGLMVSQDSRLSGVATVNVEVIINNVSGHINAHGRVVLQPADYPGSTWEGDFNIHVPGGQSIDVNGIMIVKDSQMNARGTGGFDGQWFFFSHGIGDPNAVPPVSDPDGPGGCDFSGEIFSGTILNPNSA